MIGSFWNLCRACPSMPIDKLHSEYRSTYRWHEYTGGPEVIRRPPVPNQFGPANEPPLPRRKKCPELAYRTHEFISCDETDKSSTNNVNRARSEERGATPSRRSKSEGPPQGNGRAAGPIANGGITINGEDTLKKTSRQAGESSGLFKKTISKLSTEYRLQFVWPHVRRSLKAAGGGCDNVVDPPRKSLSMGAIKSSQPNSHLPLVHKKRTANENEAAIHELEPLFKDDEIKHERKHYEKNVMDKEKFGFVAEKKMDLHRNENKMNGHAGIPKETWYKDVIELRKKAGEYKSRGWGTEIDPDLYKKQKDIWEHVSRRSSLSALSLASTVRPITKEEKEKENNKKSSPTKAAGVRFPGHALPVEKHVEEGAIIPSPTRDKLMPAIPKSKDDESYNSQRGSPKKSATSRHSSPQKGSPQKGSPKKMTKVGRSQSVGPNQNESSPKRQMRSVSTAPNNQNSTTSAAAPPVVKPHKKTPVSTPTGERRPRPTTLSTTARTRKSTSLPPHIRALSAPNQNHLNSQIDQNKISPSTLNVPILRKTNKSKPRPKSMGISGLMTDSTYKFDEPRNNKKIAETDDETTEKDGGTSISSASPLPPLDYITEHIIKSPPEPTRVKSPEQILMRSPDPVNWTVPLDTGKTFTVTQNVRDGEILNRPQSEFKATTPVDKPPPAPLSAPPGLAEQAKMEAWKPDETKSNEISNTTSSSSITPNIVNPPPPSLPEVRFDKPIPGSTLRCLDDPIFDPEINSPSSNRNNATGVVASGSVATDVLEKARNRFDRFWGGNEKEEPEAKV